MLSYAVDLAVRVDRDEKDETSIKRATVTGGVLTVTHVEQRRMHYRIVGPANEDRVVVLEELRDPDFTPTRSSEPFAMTPDRYRFRREVPAGKTVDVDVVLERPVSEEIKLVSISEADLAAFSMSGEIPEATRLALARLASLRTAVATREVELSLLQAERTQVVADQARLRENLKAVPANSDLGARYLRELGATEDRLAALDTRIAAASKDVQTAREALAAYLRTLSF
jgi:hypothetical protein